MLYGIDWDEWIVTWKETVVACFKLLYRNSPGDTEEKHVKVYLLNTCLERYHYIHMFDIKIWILNVDTAI